MVFLEPRKKQRTIAGIRELSHGWGICSSELCPSCAIHGLKARRPLHVWGFDGRQGKGLWGNAQVGYNPCPSLYSSRLSGSISMTLFFIYVLAFTFIYWFGCTGSSLWYTDLSLLRCTGSSVVAGGILPKTRELLADLAPWPGKEPGPPALGARSLSHWTTRGVRNLHDSWSPLWKMQMIILIPASPKGLKITFERGTSQTNSNPEVTVKSQKVFSLAKYCLSSWRILSNHHNIATTAPHNRCCCQAILQKSKLCVSKNLNNPLTELGLALCPATS